MSQPVFLHVVGARPNFMKVAPLLKELESQPVRQILVHTGQHYDKNLSEAFFEDLGIRKPDYNLGVGSGSHTKQTANTMLAFEEVCEKEKPTLVVVYGDVNSTIACALVAKKEGIALAHVEAGLRNFDHSMPEELNRLVTDTLADYLFVPEPSGVENLRKEGVKGQIHLVGNIMIDTLAKQLPRIEALQAHEEHGFQKKKYGLLTMHRPANVDHNESLTKILDALEQIDLPFIFPMHPRTKKRIEEFQLQQRLENMKNLIVVEPISYLHMMSLLQNAKLLITDSGGLQEESTYMQVPCITMRPNTERLITVQEGTSTLTGNDTEKIVETAKTILAGKTKPGNVPSVYDGETAPRIAKILMEVYGEQPQ